MKNKKINLISNYVKIFILVFVFILAISYIFYNIKATNTLSDISNNTQNDDMSNTNLETLAIENVLLYPPFDTNITHYNVEIPNEVNQLNILAIPENEMASVQITGNDSLKEGTNLIQITVIAQNGYSKKVFEVNCYKRKKGEEVLFQKEQEENRKKLEEIYQVEKLSSKNGEAEAVSTKTFKGSAWIIIIIMIVILIAVGVGVMRKIRGRN